MIGCKKNNVILSEARGMLGMTLFRQSLSALSQLPVLNSPQLHLSLSHPPL